MTSLLLFYMMMMMVIVFDSTTSTILYFEVSLFSLSKNNKELYVDVDVLLMAF
jgi:hypothetical protein